MAYYSYPESRKNTVKTDAEKILEELDIRGFSVRENVLSSAQIKKFRDAVDEAWKKQIADHGEKKLRELGEWGQARALLLFDPSFSELILHKEVTEITRACVGESAILHCMNGSISFPGEEYAQSRWHRDFEKDLRTDKILSVNALWVLDDFEEKSGATVVVPHSHKLSYIPSDGYLAKHAVTLLAKAGSLVFFDSRLYHRAGRNNSESARRALNFQYTRPFLKQQMDFPALFKGRVERETPLGRALGMWSVPPKDLEEFRAGPEKRSYKPGEG